MAESCSESSDDPDSSNSKHITSSFFNIPGFFVGFGTKGSSESDPGKSPTSPLDFGVFSNFGGLFSPRSPVGSSPKSWRTNKWDGGKVGLSILNSLADETELGKDDLDDSIKRENVVLGPQIKIKILESSRNVCEPVDQSLKLNYLTESYAASSLPDSKTNLQEYDDDSDQIFGDERAVDEAILSAKSCSSPMNIVSAREITLSEDYTCIISHGPNPKTTHLFGDQVLECDPNELENFESKEHPESGKQDSPPNPSVEASNYCSSCNKLQDLQDIYIYSEGKAYCSFGCQSDETNADGESDNTCENSLEISSESSFHEDMFPMGMPLI